MTIAQAEAVAEVWPSSCEASAGVKATALEDTTPAQTPSEDTSMPEVRQELRRVALEHLTKSILANEAAGAGSDNEGGIKDDVEEGGVAQILLEAKGDEDDLPKNLFDMDRVLENMPLLRTDHAFFETMNSDETISCPFVLYKPRRERPGIEAVVRFGKSTAGHPETVHGGVTAMTFDNLLGTALFMHGTFPVFTAYLKVDYKAMLPCMTTTVLDVTVDRVEGRKLFVAGRLKSFDGEVLYATAEALFIKPREEPKEAARGDKQDVREA